MSEEMKTDYQGGTNTTPLPPRTIPMGSPSNRGRSNVGRDARIVAMEDQTRRDIRDMSSAALRAGSSMIRSHGQQSEQLARSEYAGMGLGGSPVSTRGIAAIRGETQGNLTQLAAATTQRELELGVQSRMQEIQMLWQSGENQRAIDAQINMQREYMDHQLRLMREQRSASGWQAILGWAGKVGTLAAGAFIPGMQWLLPGAIGSMAGSAASAAGGGGGNYVAPTQSYTGSYGAGAGQYGAYQTPNYREF